MLVYISGYICYKVSRSACDQCKGILMPFAYISELLELAQGACLSFQLWATNSACILLISTLGNQFSMYFADFSGQWIYVTKCRDLHVINVK